MTDSESIFWVVLINVVLTPFIFAKNFNKNKILNFIQYTSIIGIIVCIAITCSNNPNRNSESDT